MTYFGKKIEEFEKEKAIEKFISNTNIENYSDIGEKLNLMNENIKEIYEVIARMELSRRKFSRREIDYFIHSMKQKL